MRFNPAALAFSRAAPADEVGLLHLDEAVEAGFPDVDGVGNFVSVERQLAFQPQRVSRTQTTWNGTEFFSRFEELFPYAGAGRFVGGNVDFESILGGIAGARDQNVFQAADGAARDPVELYGGKIGVGQLLQQVHGSWTLDRDLREIVGKMLDLAVEFTGIVAHPVEVFFARPGIDDEEIFVFAEAMDDDVIDERALGIEKSGVLRLPDRQAGRVVHGDVLDGGERLRPGEPDVSHVADVEDADPSADRVVLGHDAAGGGVLHGHVPAIEFDHLGAHLAVDGVERGLADGRRSRLDSRQAESSIRCAVGWAAESWNS